MEHEEARPVRAALTHSSARLVGSPVVWLHARLPPGSDQGRVFGPCNQQDVLEHFMVALAAVDGPHRLSVRWSEAADSTGVWVGVQGRAGTGPSACRARDALVRVIEDFNLAFDGSMTRAATDPLLPPPQVTWLPEREGAPLGGGSGWQPLRERLMAIALVLDQPVLALDLDLGPQPAELRCAALRAAATVRHRADVLKSSPLLAQPEQVAQNQAFQRRTRHLERRALDLRARLRLHALRPPSPFGRRAVEAALAASNIPVRPGPPGASAPAMGAVLADVAAMALFETPEGSPPDPEDP